MKTIIKKSIKFELNDHEKVNVYENGEFLSEIDIGIHAILCLFNGFLDDDEILLLFQNIFHLDKETSVNIFNKVINSFKYILEMSNNEKRHYEVYLTSMQKINLNRIRAIVPNKLVISLTRDCFMKCRYCYAGANYCKVASKENSITTHLIEKILSEAKNIGIEHVDITGGDPFARKDIFKVLDLFQKYNITTSLSTKKILSDLEISRLKLYNIIKEIQISIDSLDDQIQEKLIFMEKYSSQILKVIEKLVENNFSVKVNSVVTSLNIEGIIDLIRYLNNLKIKTHVISPYANNLWRHDSSLFPEYSQYEKLKLQIKNLKLDIKIDCPEFLKNDDINIYGNIGQVTCAAGLDGLIISPSGTVGICERLIYNDEYCIGNINESTILQIWNSPKLKSYYEPDPEQFRGTRCYECGHMNYCIGIRGICYVHSLILNNKIFAPDNNCVYHTGQMRLF